MAKLIIRAAQTGEMPAIRRLIALHPRHLVQKDLPRIPSFFVATVDDQIIGCCALQIYSQRLAEIRSLAIHPDHVGRGIASRLVEECKRRAAQRCVKQILAVSGEAAPFFEKHGFSTFRKERMALFFDFPGKEE